MTALDAVSVYLPPTGVPIEDLAGSLELSEMQVKLFRRFHGLREVHRESDVSLTDLLGRAIAALTELRGQEHRVRYVVYGRAFPVVAPYPANPLHDACRAAGLAHAVAFTVTQQSCASGLLAVDVAGRLLSGGGPEDLALVLTGEKTFTRDAQFLPETSVFSEGAAACLVSAAGPRNRVLAYTCHQRGEFDVAGGEPATRFQREYRPSLAEVIRQVVAEAGLSLDEVRLVLPHNVNIVTWQRLARLLGFPLDRVLLDNVATHGHVFCSDAFANYRTAVEQGRLAEGDVFLLAAVGAGHGATFSAMLVQH